MWLPAVAVQVKEVVVVSVLLVLVVSLVLKERAREGHPAISTVAPKVNPGVEFHHLVIFVAVQHAPQTYPMRLELVHVLWRDYKALGHELVLVKGFPMKLLELLRVAGDATVHLLVDVSIRISAPFGQLYIKNCKLS